MVEVIPGFSLTNRWLLYTSIMLTPAQAISGLGSHLPTSVGFLAYNWYNQYIFYNAVKHKQLHALSLFPVFLNFVYAFTYPGGITSGNIVMDILLVFGTVGLIVFNNIIAWKCLATNLPEGYGIYRFFFFGWRTLTPAWRTFFRLWQIADTILLFVAVIGIVVIAIYLSRKSDDDLPSSEVRYVAVLLAPLGLVFIWPLILWTELLVSGNHIKSETDMVAVWLFVAQVVTMLIPEPSWSWIRSKLEFVCSFKGRISFCSEGSATSSTSLPVAIGNLKET